MSDSIKDRYWSASTKRPCPICKRPNAEHTSRYCLIAKDGTHYVCSFVESRRRWGSTGWVHRNSESSGKPAPRPPSHKIAASIDFKFLTESYIKAGAKKLSLLSAELGVSVESLRALRTGWDGDAWTFPMQDDKGRIVGIRRRLPDGKKLSVQGGREGLFVPTDLNGESPIYVCEGASDTMAMHGLGLPAVGRPSCNGGVAYLVAVCKGKRTVIVADDDAPGLRGARELKAKLKDATVIVPPVGKDARAWIVQHGATREDVLAMSNKE